MRMAVRKHTVYKGVLLVAVFLMFSSAIAGIDDGVVAYYPFNGNMLDESGNDYDGVVPDYCNEPTLTEDRYGDSSSAYAFDQACIKIGPGGSQGLPSWETYSVSVWFLNDGSDEGQGYGQKVIDQTTWYSDFYISVHGNADGHLNFFTYQGGGAGFSLQDYDYGDNQWHHVVVNKDGTHGEFWVDGTLEATTNNIKTVINDQPLLLGYSQSGDSFQRKYWSGNLDDVRLYDRMLTEEEVRELLLGTAVAAALDAAGIDHANTPQAVLDALITADTAGLLEVIPPSTTVNDNLTLQADAAVVLGSGAVVDGNIEGEADSTVVIGGDGSVKGNIIGVGTSFVGGSNVEVDGNLIDEMTNALLVGPGAEVLFNGNVGVATLVMEKEGAIVIHGNLQVVESLNLGPDASLDVDGNLGCDTGTTAEIDATASISIGGNNECQALQ